MHLNDTDFDTVRYKTRAGDVIKFSGRPIYRLGQKTAKIREFEAVSIVEIRNEKW